MLTRRECRSQMFALLFRYCSRDFIAFARPSVCSLILEARRTSAGAAPESTRGAAQVRSPPPPREWSFCGMKSVEVPEEKARVCCSCPLTAVWAPVLETTRQGIGCTLTSFTGTLPTIHSRTTPRGRNFVRIDWRQTLSWLL